MMNMVDVVQVSLFIKNPKKPGHIESVLDATGV